MKRSILLLLAPALCIADTYFQCTDRNGQVSYQVYRCGKNSTTRHLHDISQMPDPRNMEYANLVLQCAPCRPGYSFGWRTTDSSRPADPVASNTPKASGNAGQITLGISAQQVRAILGEPKEVLTSESKDKNGVSHSEYWTYQRDANSPPQFIEFKDGIVTKTNTNSVTGQSNSTFSYK